MAAERHVLIHNGGHPSANRIHICLAQRSLVSLIDHAVISLGDRSADSQAALREKVFDAFIKQEAERAAIEIPPSVGTVVEKLHVKVVIDPEPEPLGDIIHLGGQDVIGLVKLELPGDLPESGSFSEFFR